MPLSNIVFSSRFNDAKEKKKTSFWTLYMDKQLNELERLSPREIEPGESSLISF